MSAPQNFRSAFNGFNREDVVHYLEYINAKHTAQVNQLTAENDTLFAQLKNQPEEGLVQSLQDECAQLRAQLEDAQAKVKALEEQLAAVPEEKAASAAPEQPVPFVYEELETYRRAERTEREARERAESIERIAQERAELVYFQASSVLTDATGKVDGLADNIADMADQVMDQLTQLQKAVSDSKQALREASTLVSSIRPNK